MRYTERRLQSTQLLGDQLIMMDPIQYPTLVQAYQTPLLSTDTISLHTFRCANGINDRNNEEVSASFASSV